MSDARYEIGAWGDRGVQLAVARHLGKMFVNIDLSIPAQRARANEVRASLGARALRAFDQNAGQRYTGASSDRGNEPTDDYVPRWADEMGGDPTAGMDASGLEPWCKEDEDIIRPDTEQHTQSVGEQE